MQNTKDSMKRIEKAHIEEWNQSAVDPEITKLAIESIKGGRVYEELFEFRGEEIRRNDGRLRDGFLKRYELPAKGGWLARGVDILSSELTPSRFFCFKPDTPRKAGAKPEAKAIKYEHPDGYPAELFALRMPIKCWERAAERFHVAIPSTITVTAEGEGIGFWAWVLDHPEIPVVITEGAKKAGSLLSFGYAAIALPGISGGYRQPKDEAGNRDRSQRRVLLPHLRPFAVNGRKIYFAFDRDTKRVTVRAVDRDINRTADLLRHEGAGEIRVCLWNNGYKGADDLIVNCGIQAFDAAFETSPILAIWSARQLTRLTRPVDVKVCDHYLGDIDIPSSVKIVCLKSPKGTGKTEWLVRQVDTAIRDGRPVLVITHRVQLQTSLCERFGLNTLDEVRYSDVGRLLGFGLCIDSLRKDSAAQFDPVAFSDALIIIDEAEQVYWHLLHAETEVKKHRVEILRNVSALFQEVYSGIGTIYLSDADLSDLAVDYTESLIGQPVGSFVVENTWKSSQLQTVYHYTQNTPKRLVGDLIGKIREGGRHLLIVSGRREKSQWGTKTLERYIREKFPTKRVLRIDSESIVDRHHAAYRCMANLDQVLSQYDIVIVSPAIETGVSIDLKGHFTDVWGIFQGVQTADSVRQSLARLREPVDRHIWVAPRGLAHIGSGDTGPKELVEYEFKKARTNLQALAAVDGSAAVDVDIEFQPMSIATWAERGATINRERHIYRDIVIYGLHEEGHAIVTVSDDDDDASPDADMEVGREVKETCTAAYAEYCIRVASVPNPDDARYEALKDAREMTEDERIEERKGALARRYGETAVTPEIVKADDEGFYQALRVYYGLTEGREFLVEKEASSQREEIIKGGGAIFLPDFNHNHIFGKVRALEVLGVTDLFAQDRLWRADDPRLAEIADLCRANAGAVKSLLGFRPYGSNMRVIQGLLKCVGLKLPRTKNRVGARGQQVYIYGWVNLNDGREAIMALWRARDEERRAKAQINPLPVVTASNTNRVDLTITTELHPALAIPSTCDHEEDVRDLTRWLAEAAEGSQEELLDILSVARETLKVIPEIGARVWHGLTASVQSAIRVIADTGTLAALASGA